MVAKVPLKLQDVGGGAGVISEFESGDTISKEHIDPDIARLENVVDLTTDQQINGIKEFLSLLKAKNTERSTVLGTPITDTIKIDNVIRWLSVLAGSNGDWAVHRYNSSGVYQDTPLHLSLADGTLSNKGRKIYETGANATGRWVRLGDGTQFCLSSPVVLSANATANYYWYYPSVFITSQPFISAIGWGSPVTGFITDGGTTERIGVRAYDHAGGYPNGVALSLFAMGRWY